MGRGRRGSWVVTNFQATWQIANRVPSPGPGFCQPQQGCLEPGGAAELPQLRPLIGPRPNLCSIPASSLAARLNRARAIFEKQNHDIKPCLHHHDILHNSITKRPSHRKISPSHPDATRKYGGRAKKAARYVPPLHNPPPPHDTPQLTLPEEQLMGGGISSRSTQLSLTDPKVCRSYLAGTCPHDLFTNTKQDLGPCPRVHSEGLKAEYEALPEAERKAKYGFEHDYLRDLQKYIDECNRRIEAAQRRLEKTPDEIRQTNVLLKAISDLGTSIATGLLEVEILGEMGEVGKAYDELFRVRQAQAGKAERERELKALSDTSGPSGHQKLQVCDVCGAYLSRLDNDRRLADHFFGKMHLGYAQMRKTYEQFPKEMRGRRGPPMGGGGGGDDDMGGASMGPGGGYADGHWRGGRGPRGGGGFRGGRGPRRGGW